MKKRNYFKLGKYKLKNAALYLLPYVVQGIVIAAVLKVTIVGVV
tara:strand:+ start:488 stop:619 length:132 start_codon:yes stop_codon:yes gene_type:complete